MQIRSTTGEMDSKEEKTHVSLGPFNIGVAPPQAERVDHYRVVLCNFLKGLEKNKKRKI